MLKPFNITYIKTPRKRERKFLELQGNAGNKYRQDCDRNFFRHFCTLRTTEQAIEAAKEHCDKFLGMGEFLENFKQALA